LDLKWIWIELLKIQSVIIKKYYALDPNFDAGMVMYIVLMGWCDDIFIFLLN